MIIVDWCPEPECLGTECSRYREQMSRWPRTLRVVVKLPHEARAIRTLVRREAMQQIYLGVVTGPDGGERHLTPAEAAYEVHPLVQATDADGTAYAAVYAGAGNPIELGLREPALSEWPTENDPGWRARREELGRLFVSEVLR